MRQNAPRRPGGVSRAATACYILFAALLLYAAARFSGRVAARELLSSTPAAPASTAAAVEDGGPARSSAPAETAAPVLAVRTPAPTAAPQPAPAPSASIPAAMEQGRIDLPLIALDETGHADAVTILAVRGKAGTLLSIPKNTLAGGVPLYEADTPQAALMRLEALLGVSFTEYVCYEAAAIPACVDAVGGVPLDGAACNGEQARAYLESGGRDELLRAARQQAFLQAFALRVQGMKLLEVWASRRALQNSADSNLTGEQGWLMYRTLRALSLDALELRLLPVDSLTEDGVRLYRADEEILAGIVTELYKTR